MERIKAFWIRLKLWQKALVILVALAVVVPKGGGQQQQAPEAASKSAEAPKPAAIAPAKVEPPKADPPAVEAGKPAVTVNGDAAKKLADVASGITGKGVKMGAQQVDPFVTDNLADVLMKVDSSNATTRVAYQAKMLNVAREVANAGMKLDGITKVHVLVESDGAFGSPKDSLALNLVYSKEKVTPVKWGNLTTAEEMLYEASDKDTNEWVWTR